MQSADSEGATDGVLSKTCDTGVLGFLIDSIINRLEVMQRGWDTMLRLVEKAIEWADRMTLGLIPWLDEVQRGIEAARVKVNESIDATQRGLKGLEAPWYIKCVGEKLRDGMAPRATAFADSLEPADLKSKESWKGEGANAFFKAADKQQEAAVEAKGGVLTFGNAMVTMGDGGITATNSFFVALGFGVVGLIQAIATMAAVPAGTAVGAAEVIAYFGAIVALIQAFVEWVNSATNQAREFTSAVATVPMQGNWPAATV